MKAFSNSNRRNRRFSPASLRLLASALPVFAFAGLAHAGYIKIITPAEILRDAREKEASLRAEANAPGLSPAAERRIQQAMAAIKAKEEEEVADQARFEFEQRLKLAEAGAPRIYINMGGSGMNIGGSEMEHNGVTFGGSWSTSRRYSKYEALAEKYANKHYLTGALRDSVEEESADASKRIDQVNESNDGGAPYGSPVEGKPGLVTSPLSPNSGYIDVRGYTPGSQVVDPYSGQVMRVP